MTGFKGNCVIHVHWSVTFLHCGMFSTLCTTFTHVGFPDNSNTQYSPTTMRKSPTGIQGVIDMYRKELFASITHCECSMSSSVRILTCKESNLCTTTSSCLYMHCCMYVCMNVIASKSIKDFLQECCKYSCGYSKWC